MFSTLYVIINRYVGRGFSMFLKRVEASGFKSFADKTVIVFDHDVIGVVGPNGCGKSNISDAIRWVLGEQSPKSLRGSSMSDVIFKGSQTRKACNKAEVTLVFDNSNHLLPIEYEEVEITRVLYSSGESEYFLNKAACRLKDITNLIMDTGLGRDSLSIISQGNITSFAEAKPEERRAIFEEAAGVAKYKKRKIESISKLDRTQDNLNRVEDIIAELEKQVSPLRRQAEKAKKYLNLKEQLEDVEVAVLVDEITNQNEQIENMRKTLSDFEIDKVKNESMISVSDAKLVEMRQEISHLDYEVNQLQEQYAKMVDTIKGLENRKFELDEKRRHWLESQIEISPEKIAMMQSACEEARLEYVDRKGRVETLNREMEEAKSSLVKKEEMKRHAENELSNAQGKLNRCENRKEVLKSLIEQPLNHQAGVRSIMDAKKSLQGIEGVMVDLVKPAEGFESAISTALGGALYNIVTRDSDCARYAVDFLKRNQSGRATFLPLTSLQGRSMNREHEIAASTIKGYIGIASNYASIDAKYQVVVDALLGRVLVCEDLKAANEVSALVKYSYKVVTLDGDVVNIGGSITGGKVKNQETPMVLRREYETIDRDIDSYHIDVNSWQDQLSILNRDIAVLNDQMMAKRITLAQLEPIVGVKKEKYEKLSDELKAIGQMEQTAQSAPTEDTYLITKLNEAYQKRDSLEMDMKSKRERRIAMSNECERMDEEIRTIRRGLSGSNAQMHDIELNMTRLETRLENGLERLNSEYKMTFEYACEHCKKEINILEARTEVELLRQQIASLGNINMDAPAQFEEVNTRYQELTAQKQDLEDARNKILNAINEMDEVMSEEFTATFNAINEELDGVFTSLFGGGHARLFMVDPENVLETGIDIDVQPPGKKVQNMRLFSGGEKSLIALAVLFSIMKCRSVPLCILDECESALDPANVERFARYLKQFSGQTQFIVVTHRPGTMEQCDALYGVTMQQKGVTKMIQVKLAEAVQLSEKEEA